MKDTLAEDLAEAIERGIDADVYCMAVTNGVPHVDYIEAVGAGWNYRQYALARRAGTTHAECMSVPGYPRMDHFNYLLAREAGATHAECNRALSVVSDLRTYASARMNGITHQELEEAAYSCSDISGYVALRKVGSTNQEALAVLALL